MSSFLYFTRRMMIRTRTTTTNFTKLLRDRPVLSNSILCAGLYTAGDISAQYIEQHVLVGEGGVDNENENENKNKNKNENITMMTSAMVESTLSSSSASSSSLEETKTSTTADIATPPLFHWDTERTARISSFGAMITGPLLAVWYPFLERITKRNSIVRYGSLAVPIVKVIMDEFVLEPPFLLVFFGYMTVAEGGSRQDYYMKLSNEYLHTYKTSLTGWPIILLLNFRFVPVFAQSAVVNTCCVVWNGFLSYRNAQSKSTTTETTTLVADDTTAATTTTTSSTMVTTSPTVEEDMHYHIDHHHHHHHRHNTNSGSTTTTTTTSRRGVGVMAVSPGDTNI